MTLRVAVLYGGNSAEREVSLKSGQAVAKALASVGVDSFLFDPKERALAELKILNIDCAFIALHGRGGEDGTIQGALELMNIPYTGAGVIGSALCMDKVRTKLIFKGFGIPTAAFEVVDKSTYLPAQSATILASLGGKAMVKPANEGSSIGMSIVTNDQELTAAIEKAFDYDTQVLVEAWIDGPEYTVAILGDKALPSIHMATPNAFYDYEAKYQSAQTIYHCPSGLSDEDEKTLREIALAAFSVTGAKVWGRVDVMRDSTGNWQVLEVNTAPGMTETSLVPKAANVEGLAFGPLVKRIVEISIAGD